MGRVRHSVGIALSTSTVAVVYLHRCQYRWGTTRQIGAEDWSAALEGALLECRRTAPLHTRCAVAMGVEASQVKTLFRVPSTLSNSEAAAMVENSRSALFMGNQAALLSGGVHRAPDGQWIASALDRERAETAAGICEAYGLRVVGWFAAAIRAEPAIRDGRVSWFDGSSWGEIGRTRGTTTEVRPLRSIGSFRLAPEALLADAGRAASVAEGEDLARVILHPLEKTRRRLDRARTALLAVAGIAMLGLGADAARLHHLADQHRSRLPESVRSPTETDSIEGYASRTSAALDELGHAAMSRPVSPLLYHVVSAATDRATIHTIEIDSIGQGRVSLLTSDLRSMLSALETALPDWQVEVDGPVELRSGDNGILESATLVLAPPASGGVP